MESTEVQELREQGLRNLALMTQAAYEHLLGDDADFEPLFPKDTRYVDIEDAAWLGIMRPTEHIAFTEWVIDEDLNIEERKQGMTLIPYEPRIEQNEYRRYHALYAEAVHRYMAAKKALIKSLKECKTYWECDHEYARFLGVCKALNKATGLDDAYDTMPKVIAYAIKDACIRIEAEMFLRERRKADRDARFARLEKIENEKEKRAAYLASTHETVFKFNKEVVSA